MKITVEQKELELDDRIITELENYHKNSNSIYNENNEQLKSAFNIILLKDNADIINVDKLFNKLDIEVIKNKKDFLKSIKKKPIENDFLIKDGSGWRIQSHYIGYGMDVESLEKCVTYIFKKTEKTSKKTSKKDYTKDKIKSRIIELKHGKALYDENEKISDYRKASYSEEAHLFWKSTDLIIKELEKFI